MAEYEYNLYAENGDITTGTRKTPFDLDELQEFVGGNIEIIAGKSLPFKGKVFVVCEDGLYKYKRNSVLPQFYGPVLIANKKLVK